MTDGTNAEFESSVLIPPIGVEKHERMPLFMLRLSGG